MKWCQPVKESLRVEITLPDLGTTRIKFSLWYVELGESVFEGDRVAEVLIPGATFDVVTPTTGRLIERRKHPYDPVTFGDVLGMIEEQL
jgi:pyruvate/2-oxoglutarate dehydrogenase complex dihydrolipoamide acyltransferase (E2) component